MFALRLSSSGSTCSFLVSFKFFNSTQTYTACSSWLYVVVINNPQDRNTRIAFNHKEIVMIRRQIPLFASDFTLFIIYLLPVKHAADLRTLNWARGRGWIPIHSNPHNQSLAWITRRLSPLVWWSHGAGCSFATHPVIPCLRSWCSLLSVPQCYLSLHLIWDSGPGPGLQTSSWSHPHHSAPAPVGDKFESWCCSHLGSPGQQPAALGPGFCPSVDPLSAASPSDTLMRTVTPSRDHTLISRISF